MKFSENPASGDPSSIHQEFEKIDVNVQCCRYWWLKRWKHSRLSYPYWRLYWNKVPGAYVIYEEMIRLDPDHILLIPPHTPFNTDIQSDTDDDKEPYVLEGGLINSHELERLSIEKGYIPHFFIHFNLGYRFDSIKPGIYLCNIDDTQRGLVDVLTRKLMHESRSFQLQHSMDIYNLIFSALRNVPEEDWLDFTLIAKIRQVLNYMNLNLTEALTNTELSSLVHMAPVSFARLFKQQTGQTPQEYLRNKRVDHASKLLFHTDKSIKQISEECGFSDRYYFTRVFANCMGVPPARYRKNLQLKVTDNASI